MVPLILRKSASATLTKSAALTAIAATKASEEEEDGATLEEDGFTEDEDGFTEDEDGFADEELGATLVEDGACELEAGTEELLFGTLELPCPKQDVMPSANMSVIMLKNFVFFIKCMQLYVAFLSLRFLH